MSATPLASVVDFPAPNNSSNHYASGYLDGFDDGKQFANRHFFLAGITVGLVFAAMLVVTVLAIEGFAR